MNKNQARILIVDDEDRSRRLLEALLQQQNFHTRAVSSGSEALESAPDYQPDLILLDLMMPGMSGFEVTKRLKSDPVTRNIPIIIVSALEDRSSRIRALEAGAEEYLTKPIDRMDLKIRVRNLLRLKELSDFLKKHNEILEEKVEERTRQLQNAFMESIFTLMCAAEYRDDETGAHIKRISYYTKALAEEMGMDRRYCESIFYASPMHDVGKIGIPDAVLLKPGRLTAEEWEIMKSHTTIGSRILAHTTSPYLRMGQEIALNHHERWDGSGYPQGLKGNDIPLSARIMQICDVYDALRSKRPYKDPFDHEKSMDIICHGDGRTSPSHFDPDVLAAFRNRHLRLREIFATYEE